jgi:hypothetical protein
VRWGSSEAITRRGLCRAGLSRKREKLTGGGVLLGAGDGLLGDGQALVTDHDLGVTAGMQLGELERAPVVEADAYVADAVSGGHEDLGGLIHGDGAFGEIPDLTIGRLDLRLGDVMAAPVLDGDGAHIGLLVEVGCRRVLGGESRGRGKEQAGKEEARRHGYGTRKARGGRDHVFEMTIALTR